jgi:type VI secretion system protein ImpA
LKGIVVLDLEDLLRSFDDDEPSGPDLEYDPEFTALELASQPGEERVVGGSTIPAEDPDFVEVAQAAIALLGRTKDLRVAVILANAGLRTEGVSAFAETLSYMRRCLEDFWDSVHPQLDEDDDDDPTMRVNTVLGLTDRAGVLASLRAAPLVRSRAFGRFSLRDILVAEGELTPSSDMEEMPTPQVISAAFQDGDAEDLVAVADAISASLDHVKAISACLDERVGGQAPDLTPLEKTLYDIKRRLAAHVESDVVEVEEGASEEEMVGDLPSVPAGRPGAMGAITSPDDVKKAIDRILDYYARHEPSSPLPILLNRARRLVSADFLTIMRDMAPLGLENVELIGGIQESDDD